jgi:hypothetical protein
MRFYRATTRNGVTRGRSYGLTGAFFGPIIQLMLVVGLVIAAPIILWQVVTSNSYVFGFFICMVFCLVVEILVPKKKR